MTDAWFTLVLHAHLPFVRHADDPTVMEEHWLYEAITGSYLPLLQVFEGLGRDGVHGRATLSLSPTLLSMLGDELLRERTADHLDDLLLLAEKEVERTRPEPHYHRLALFYQARFASLRQTWHAHDGDLVAAFRRLQDAGRLELCTSTATHAFFPLLDRNQGAIRAQVHTAADLYERCFGRRPPGMWLGECAYVPGVDEVLREAGVRWFIVDTHGLLHADRRPAWGVHAPVWCPGGVAAFARDPVSSEQVWSAAHGYPSDPHYRDFYRDIGFDLPMSYIGPHVHPEGHRVATGFKYHAITHAALHDKWVYDPDAADHRVARDAAHFRDGLLRRARGLRAEMDRPPVVVSPYDAELFGHWWFEGPSFLDRVLRGLHGSAVRAISCGDYLDRHPVNQVATPSISSWGRDGYASLWCNESNAWMLGHLHPAGERMVELARRHRANTDPLVERALRQAARELMLAQSSDWPFILGTGTTSAYAARRFETHIARFVRLERALAAGRVDEAELAAMEDQDNLFPDVDFRLYAS